MFTLNHTWKIKPNFMKCARTVNAGKESKYMITMNAEISRASVSGLGSHISIGIQHGNKEIRKMAESKCNSCLNSRLIISENGLHPICTLPTKKACDCITGRKNYCIKIKKEGKQ